MRRHSSLPEEQARRSPGGGYLGRVNQTAMEPDQRTGFARPRKEIEEITRLYLSGKSLVEIHKMNGMSREAIRIILHREGIHMRHTHEILHDPDTSLNGDTALLLGLHAGDGHLSDSWGLSIGGNDVEMGNLVVGLVRKVIGVEPYFDRRRKGNYFVVRSGKEQVRMFFERYGFRPGKKAGTVEPPREVMLSRDPHVWTGFLRGAFSADGSFWFKGKSGQCRFEVSSVRFRDGFIDLASRLGFEFRAYSYVHHGGHNKLPLHLAYLGMRAEVVRWMEQVGSISDTHNRRFRRWVLNIGEISRLSSLSKAF